MSVQYESSSTPDPGNDLSLSVSGAPQATNPARLNGRSIIGGFEDGDSTVVSAIP
jgi:hypothetical protein